MNTNGSENTDLVFHVVFAVFSTELELWVPCTLCGEVNTDTVGSDPVYQLFVIKVTRKPSETIRHNQK